MSNQGNADEPPPEDNATLEDATEGPPKKKFKKVNTKKKMIQPPLLCGTDIVVIEGLRISYDLPRDVKEEIAVIRSLGSQGLSNASAHASYFVPEFSTGVSFTIYPFPPGTILQSLFPANLVDFSAWREADNECDVHCVGRSTALDYYLIRHEVGRPMMVGSELLRVKNITAHGYGTHRKFSRLFIVSDMEEQAVGRLLSSAGLRLGTHLYIYSITADTICVSASERLVILVLFRFLQDKDLSVTLDAPMDTRLLGATFLGTPPPTPALNFLASSTRIRRKKANEGKGKNARKARRRRIEQANKDSEDECLQDDNEAGPEVPESVEEDSPGEDLSAALISDQDEVLVEEEHKLAYDPWALQDFDIGDPNDSYVRHPLKHLSMEEYSRRLDAYKRYVAYYSVSTSVAVWSELCSA